MKALSQITIYGAFLMAVLGSALGQKIQNDFDHQANFSQYKTYSWQAIKTFDSLWDARVKNAVNGQLAAKGWTQAENGTQADNGAQSPSAPSAAPALPPPPPGFPALPSPPAAAALPATTLACRTSEPCVVIVAIQTTQNRKSLQMFYDSMGGGWGWRGGGGFGDATITEQDYEEGTLVIDMYDAKTKQLLWRGSAEGTLSDKAGKNEQKLEKAVAKMFKDFPPGSTQGKR
ncbi:MAG TPA: DUF4136 domain-containing protein [Acidobacteriaceae bacterium]|jgi:hypothetical protein